MEATFAQETWNSQRAQYTKSHIVTIERKITTQQWFWAGPNGQRVLDLDVTTALCHLITLSNCRLVIVSMIKHQKIVGLTIQRIGVD